MAQFLRWKRRDMENETARTLIEHSNSPSPIVASLDVSHPELEPDSEFAPLVERVRQNGFPWVVVSAAAVARWERQDPEGWRKVSAWVEARGVCLVRI